MRITQVMLASGYGGAERSFVDLSLALHARGHVLQVICHPRFPGRAEFERAGGIDLVTVHALGTWDPFARTRIRKALARFAPAVVQAHLARAAHLAGAAAHAEGLPVIAKTHNYVNVEYYHHVDRLVATTADQRAWLLDQGIAAERVHLIPNFSAVPLAAPRDSRGTPLRLLAYGRFVRKKGFDLLLRALAEHELGSDWRLTLGGEGPHGRELRALARDPRLRGRVDLCGWIGDVRAALLAHDLFVLPSRDEPFGIALLEAMAAGTPILATRTQGPREILDDTTAVLVEPNDAAALAHGLSAAVADPSRCARLAHAAQDRFGQCYTPAAVVPQYEALFAELPAR